jgi:hypothetical protein
MGSNCEWALLPMCIRLLRDWSCKVLGGANIVLMHLSSLQQDLTSTYRIQVVGCMKRYICCGALPQLSGSCDPYLCLDVGTTRYVEEPA